MNSYRLVPSESASVEVSALITVLRETDQRLKELKKGESAASRTVAAAPFLLQRAQIPLRNNEAAK